MKRTLTFLMAAAIASTAQAQSPFSYEAGLLAQLTKYEQIRMLGTVPAAGANLGIFVIPNVSLDVSLNYGPATSSRTGLDLLVQNFHSDIIANFRLAGKWRGQLGGGWSGTRFINDTTRNQYESGLNALVGLRYCMSENWSWTTQLVADFRDPADQAPAFHSALDYVLRVGLARAFGSNRTKHPCYEAALPAAPPAAITPAPAQQPAAQPPAQQPPVTPPVTPPAQQPPPQPQPQPQPAQPQPTPTPAPAPPPNRPIMTFSGVHFDFDKSNLKPAARDTVDSLVRWMNANPNANVNIVGHTDSKGTDDYNIRLGARRAESVKAYLISKGISASRITTITRGESEPVDTNETDAGRANNRRVVAIEIRP
jgi:outer membrane protein OmpA-like peptidoglycan-associated protein